MRYPIYLEELPPTLLCGYLDGADGVAHTPKVVKLGIGRPRRALYTSWSAH